ncbi:MAG: glycosyltransferase family 4 protein, partial [Anaerolineae bacterium]|nr:glycosyltransferase family 4 protein [Anaerolineae bacterium]
APRVVKIVGDLSWERGVRRGWVSPKEDIDLFQKRTRHDLRVGFDRDRLNSEARSYHSVIVPSEYLKRMVAGWGVDDAKIQVIYNALPSHYKASNLSQVEARKELDLDPDQPLLLTVGRMLPWKGVDHLIAALAQIPEVKLVAAGDGPALAQAQREAAAAGLSERVTFLGSVPRGQVPLWMKAADYVALYSGYEGLSHVLLESLRAGTPVIASDKGGNPEVIAHGVNGLLVPYVNRDALIAALREAFQPGRREALAANTAAGMERFMFGNMIAATDAELRRWV